VYVGCLVDRAAMLWVCYCVLVGLFSRVCSYVVGLLLCTGWLYSEQGSYVVGLLLCAGELFSEQGS
jgi:hypothetical protein